LFRNSNVSYVAIADVSVAKGFKGLCQTSNWRKIKKKGKRKMEAVKTAVFELANRMLDHRAVVSS